MENKNFHSSIAANISPDEAIKKISNVPEWWGINFSGSAQNENDQFVVRMGGDSFFNFTVAELIPGQRIVWLVTDCHMPWYSDKKEWAKTRLIFDLSENDGVTSIHFTHEGLTPEVECYKDCETGWTHWIRTSLLSYFTTGKGQFKQRKATVYTVEIELEKSPRYVFDHLIDLASWWPEEFAGEKIKAGAAFTLKTGEIHFSQNKVFEFVQDKKLAWLTTDSIRKTDNYDWTGTKFIFDLTPKGNNTLLKFTYDGVVLENEYDRLVQVCDMTIKEKLRNYVAHGLVKDIA